MMGIRGGAARQRMNQPSIWHHHEFVGIVAPALQEEAFLTTDTNLLHSWLDGRIRMELG